MLLDQRAMDVHIQLKSKSNIIQAQETNWILDWAKFILR